MNANVTKPNMKSNYLNLVSTKVDTTKVKENPQAGNKKYLPIAYVEQQLDLIFRGCWNIENFHWQVIANEIVGSLDLVCQHPDNPNWVIKRCGVGAVMIQQNKGANIDDISAKIKNTLVKDFPHLKAECLKNAAKSLGTLFGRDLNREIEENFVNEVSNFEEKLNSCKNTADLKKLYNSIPHYLRDDLKSVFSEKREELEGGDHV